MSASCSLFGHFLLTHHNLIMFNIYFVIEKNGGDVARWWADDVDHDWGILFIELIIILVARSW